MTNSFAIKELKCFKSSHYETGRTDAEVPILWPPDAKSQLIGKDSDAGQD